MKYPAITANKDTKKQKYETGTNIVKMKSLP